jgi:hypothetical protein
MNGGLLFIRAAFDSGRILLREARLDRPPLTRLFAGMGEQEARAAIPLLYSLCREAQGAAAAAALARAKGDMPPEFNADRLWGETLHERLWRLCLDWPRSLQCSASAIASAREAFAAWRVHLLQPDCREKAREVLAMLADMLPDCAALREEATGMVRAWQEGRPYPFFSATPALNQGRSVILTARGWLRHEARLDEQGKIASYAIHAPTDRHFADDTQLAGLLAGHSAPNLEEAKMALERAVLLLDPCVPWKIVWENEEPHHA